MAAAGSVKPPLWLLAELTYRCPLHCAFCSNPVDYAKHSEELATADWLRVFREARAMGAVQLRLLRRRAPACATISRNSSRKHAGWATTPTCSPPGWASPRSAPRP
jgi:hypothetical protein